MMRADLLSALGLAALGLAFGCAPFAPPIRSIHGGAPGRLDPGDMEVAGAGAGVLAIGGAPVLGGGSVGFAAREHLTVEGGIDGMSGWTLGYGGVRVPGRWPVRTGVMLAADGEAGLGAGVGGEDCDATFDASCRSDSLAWWQRPAGGAYLGGGGAIRLWPVSLYVRTRAQLAAAYRAPLTHWVSGFGGVHVHILRRADLWGGVAVVHYANSDHATRAFAWELGVAFRFDPRAGWNDR